MKKEIHEQPETVVQTMRGRIVEEVPAGEDPYLFRRVRLGGLFEHRDAIRRC